MPRDVSAAIASSALYGILQGSDSERQQAAEHIVATHWKALYKYALFRHHRSADDTQASLHGFLRNILSKEFMSRFDPRVSPLRHFLRKEFDRYMGHREGSGQTPPLFPLDLTVADEEFRTEVRAVGLAADSYFENEWVRSIFTIALEELYGNLASEGKELHFTLFLKSDIQDKPREQRAFVDEVARELGLSDHDAMNALAATRQRYHQILMGIVRPLTMSESEFKREMRTIFGNAG